MTRPRAHASRVHASPIRLDFDFEGTQQVNMLRLVVAMAAGGSGLWLAVVASHWIHGLFAAAAGAASIAWIYTYRRAQATARARRFWHLLVHEEGLQKVHGTDVEHVPWTEVRHIELDEERLILILHRCSGGRLVLEPIYDGGLDGLHRILSQVAGSAP